MGIDMMVNMVISQFGEEKSKEVLNMILGMADKMSSDKIYMLKKLGKRGVCLISTDSKNCKVNFNDNNYKPQVTELENVLRKIEI